MIEFVLIVCKSDGIGTISRMKQSIVVTAIGDTYEDDDDDGDDGVVEEQPWL